MQRAFSTPKGYHIPAVQMLCSGVFIISLQFTENPPQYSVFTVVLNRCYVGCLSVNFKLSKFLMVNNGPAKDMSS